MNDFDYDCLQKKRIAHSAKKRVRQKKGCSLPSDHLTPAQRKKLNGDVIVVNVNKPIAYRYFKTLSKDLQVIYYNHLVDEFGATQSDIAKMLGVKAKTLFEYIRYRDLPVKKLGTGARLKKPEEWKLFCEGGYADKPSAMSNSSGDVSKATSSDKLTSYQLEFKNVKNWTDIFEMLTRMPLFEDGVVIVNVGGRSDE